MVRNFVEVVNKGGTLLQNIGPKADGIFPVESIARLGSIGDRMGLNVEVIYWSSVLKVQGEGKLLHEEEIDNSK